MKTPTNPQIVQALRDAMNYRLRSSVTGANEDRLICLAFHNELLNAGFSFSVCDSVWRALSQLIQKEIGAHHTVYSVLRDLPDFDEAEIQQVRFMYGHFLANYIEEEGLPL